MPKYVVKRRRKIVKRTRSKVTSVLSTDDSKTHISDLSSKPDCLVPVLVEGILIGTPDRFRQDNTSKFADISLNFGELQSEDHTYEHPFVPRTEALPTGAHIKWTLPKALRRGQSKQQDSSDYDFPILPDRWFILRSLINTTNNTLETTCWVLESNYTSTDSSQGSPYPASREQLVYLGNKYSYENTLEPPASDKLLDGLTAVGPGQAAFVSVYDHVTNVFAFHDDLNGVTANTNVNYNIIGWYADKTKDILHSAAPRSDTDWRQQLEQLRWHLVNNQDVRNDWAEWCQQHHVTSDTNIWPESTLYHGSLSNLHWKGSDSSHAPENQTTPTVTVGTNTSGSIATWLANDQHMHNLLDQNKKDEIEQLFEAISIDALDDYLDNPAQFRAKQRSAGFNAVEAGIISKVIPKDMEPEPSQPAGIQFTLDLDETTTNLLVTLNQYERELNRYHQQQQSQLEQFFNLTIKLKEARKKLIPNTGDIDKLTTAKETAEQALTTTAQQITDTTTSITEKKQALDARLASLDYQRVDSHEPLFWQPKPPVILIEGVGNTVQTNFNQFDQQASAHSLRCRITGQAITEMKMTFTQGDQSHQIALNREFIDKHLTLPNSTPLPTVCSDIWLESILLNPNNAALFCQWYCADNNLTLTTDERAALITLISTHQTALWNTDNHNESEPVIVAATLGANGVVPAKLAWQTGQTPIVPLFVDWEVDWYPSYSAPDLLQDWHFSDGQFQFNPTINTLGTAINIEGRSLAANQVITTLTSRLSQIMSSREFTPTQRENLNEALAQLHHANIITQPLSSLYDTMIQRQHQVQYPLTEPDALKDKYFPWPAYSANDEFTPFRAGHLHLKRLWIIDSFGRFLSLGEDKDDSNPLSIKPSIELRTPSDSSLPNAAQLIALRPRWCQPARVDFQFVSASNDNIVSNASLSTSPLCGWLIVNKIDNAIMVYDNFGQLQGRIQLVHRTLPPDDSAIKTTAQTQVLRWFNAPGTIRPFGEAPSFTNVHLQRLVTDLLEKGAQQATPFTQMLAAINTTLSNNVALNDDIGEQLATMISHPIAIMRAKVRLELAGLPPTNQWLSKIEEKDEDKNGGVTNVAIPLSVGNVAPGRDAVIGYYTGNDYQTLYHAHPQEETGDQPNTDYVQGNASIALKAQDANKQEYDYLTLLLDPRGQIPLVTGVLPTQQIAIAKDALVSSYRNIDITFRTGPVIVDPEKIQMPLPAKFNNNLSWVYQSGITTWQEQSDITQQNINNFPAQPRQIQEGWLTLSSITQRQE